MSVTHKENCYYGEETVVSLKNFNIGLPNDMIPSIFIHSFALLKKAYAIVNIEFGLETEVSKVITEACDDIMIDRFNDQFPLSVWQTLSGIQINTNINEVISNRAMELRGGASVHPNHEVNKNQNSHNVVSAAMHVAAISYLTDKLYPALEHLKTILKEKSEDSRGTIGQSFSENVIQRTSVKEYSKFIDQISINMEYLITCESRLCELSIGNGSNEPESLGRKIAEQLKTLTRIQFINVADKFEELKTSNKMLELSSGLNTLAITLMKIANDIRLVDLGNRCDIGDSISFENEGGGSVMPKQINLLQYEAMGTVGVQVMTNHFGITLCVSTENAKFNVFKPLIIKNILHSIRILSDSCYSFSNHLLISTKSITHTSTASMHHLPMNNPTFNDNKIISNNFERRMNYNKYPMEGEKLICTSHSNPSFQPDNQSTHADLSMPPLRHSTSKMSNNDSIKDKPLQMNDEPNTSSNMQSPLIPMIQMVNDLKSPIFPNNSSNNFRLNSSMNLIHSQYLSRSINPMDMVPQNVEFQNMNPNDFISTSSNHMPLDLHPHQPNTSPPSEPQMSPIISLATPPPPDKDNHLLPNYYF